MDGAYVVLVLVLYVLVVVVVVDGTYVVLVL